MTWNLNFSNPAKMSIKPWIPLQTLGLRVVEPEDFDK